MPEIMVCANLYSVLSQKFRFNSLFEVEYLLACASLWTVKIIGFSVFVLFPPFLVVLVDGEHVKDYNWKSD